MRLKVSIPPRSGIEATDLPYYLYYIVPYVCDRQTICLKTLPETTHFCPKSISHILSDYIAMLGAQLPYDM